MMYVSTVHASENLHVEIFQRSDDLTNHATRYQRTLTHSKENKGSLNACKCLIMKKIHHDKWVYKPAMEDSETDGNPSFSPPR